MTKCQNCSYSLADRAWHGLKDRGEDQVSKLFILHCCMLTIIMIITHCTYADHYYDYDETKWATINMITLMMKNTILITTRFPLLDH